jgi:putative spermidine/putrescine transport system substrate-binding protein
MNIICRKYAMGLALLSMLSAAGAAQARDFTIASWGGIFSDSQRANFFTPFGEEKGIKVLDDTYAGGWALFEAMLGTDTRPWDVVEVETSELVRGCEQGLFVKLDWSRIAEKTSLMPQAVSECGIGAAIASHVVAWNPSAGGPDLTLEDFFNTTKIPGKRGMRNDPKGSLEMALMADGVAPNDIYKTLSAPGGVDRAFAKLDTIKKDLQWWEAGAQPIEWLASGDVSMSIVYSGRVHSARQQGQKLGMTWLKSLLFVDQWVIVDGTGNTDTAYDFLRYFASQPKAQAAFANERGYGVPSLEAAKYLDPAILADLPAGDNVKDSLDMGSSDSVAFWLDNYDDISARWTAWKAN